MKFFMPFHLQLPLLVDKTSLEGEISKIQGGKVCSMLDELCGLI